MCQEAGAVNQEEVGRNNKLLELIQNVRGSVRAGKGRCLPFAVPQARTKLTRFAEAILVCNEPSTLAAFEKNGF